MADAKEYYDSEEVAEAVRDEVVALSRLGYNHDGAAALPLRRDVREYVRCRLFAPVSGLVRGGGGGLPRVAKDQDGTARVYFEGDDGRRLCLWVPCHAVVVLDRYTESTDVYMSVSLNSETDPHDFDDEIASAFDWLRGEGP